MKVNYKVMVGYGLFIFPAQTPELKRSTREQSGLKFVLSDWDFYSLLVSGIKECYSSSRKG